MRADVAGADRRQQVREAARGWRGAGAIDQAVCTAIETAYPDDRARLGPVFRILVFGFTIVIVNALFGLFTLGVSAAGKQAAQVLLAFFGLALVAATEVQVGPLRRTQGGTEAATAWLGVCYLLGALVWLMADSAKLGGDAWVDPALVLVVILFGAAAYRWGYALFAVIAASGLFLLLARGPLGRALWLVVPVVVAPLLLRAGDWARLPPAHRRCCQAVAVVSLGFLYLAVHLGSWDQGFVERVGAHWNGHPPWAAQSLRPFFAVATALVPVLTLAWGRGTRRRLLINAGLIGLLASMVTLRFYVHVAPLWVVLLLGGGVAIGLALALRQHLDSGPGRQRHGFTAEPLFADPEGRSALELAASVASLSPAARPVETSSFEGGGGRFGGGGASGTY